MMQRCCPGFTLMELLVTLAVMGVLAMTALPVAQLAQQRSKEETLLRALRDIRQALDAYKRASDEGRIDRRAGASGYPPNLRVLVEGVTDQRDPKRRRIHFLRQLPRDPFNPEADALDGGWLLRSYASEADDPQPGEDVYDIRSASAAIGLNGLPYREW